MQTGTTTFVSYRSPRIVICQRCGEPYETGSNNAKWCPPCGEIQERERIAARWVTEAKGIRTCERCHGTYIGGPKSRYCPEKCRTEMRRVNTSTAMLRYHELNPAYLAYPTPDHAWAAMMCSMVKHCNREYPCAECTLGDYCTLRD